jgi:sugar phosphate isomerase/epimerase
MKLHKFGKMKHGISRRQFSKLSAAGVTMMAATKISGMGIFNKVSGNCIRLGGPVWGDLADPDKWVDLLKNEGYSAAYCPVEVGANITTIRSFENSARKAGILISEVGAWCNPISKHEKVRQAALTKCKESMALADMIGAGCCVNISGSRGEQSDPDNFSKDTFDLIVQTTREIIDAVKPVRSFFTLETMPWIFPDSPDSYLDLIKAIDRKQFGVHLDPVNMISSPRRYYNSGAFIKECFQKLGPFIKNCHAKDILLQSNLTVHLDEVLLGTGGLDYKVFLTELSKLKNVPLMLEHLKSKEDYTQAAGNIRRIGESIGIKFCEGQTVV